MYCTANNNMASEIIEKLTGKISDLEESLNVANEAGAKLSV